MQEVYAAEQRFLKIHIFRLRNHPCMSQHQEREVVWAFNLLPVHLFHWGLSQFTEERSGSLRRDPEGQIPLVCTKSTQLYCTSALWHCSIHLYFNYPTYLNNKKTFQANEHIAHLKLRHNTRLWGLVLSVTINDIFMYATPLAKVLMLCPPIH